MNYLIADNMFNRDNFLWLTQNRTGRTSDIRKAGRFEYKDAELLLEYCGDRFSVYPEEEISELPTTLCISREHAKWNRLGMPGYDLNELMAQEIPRFDEQLAALRNKFEALPAPGDPNLDESNIIFARMLIKGLIELNNS